ncbi:MAG: hypothetical protein ACK4Q4_02690 [Rhodocyclaceae bacterium]
MHLTLLVPGLLLPVEILESTTFDLAAPSLSQIIGRGIRRTLPVAALAHLFGLERLPAAALRRLGAEAANNARGAAAGGVVAAVSGTETVPGEWLCLDPVHWQVGHRGVTLDDPARLGLDTAESAALLEVVAPLFADWGELSASAPGRWELCLKRPYALETQPLHEAIDQPIDPRLPDGADGLAWRRLLLEAQTVLHDHPVNRAREAVGRPTINSLWPWGQGALPEKPSSAFDAVSSDDPVMVGLCAHAGIPCLPPSKVFRPAKGRVLVVMEDLAAAARTLDALAWREALLAFERDWLAPALSACRTVRLIGTRLGWQPATVAYEWERTDRLRFWRRPLPLTALK